jgi:hypothetical protein
VRIWLGQPVEHCSQAFSGEHGLEFHRVRLGKNQNIVGTILHLGLADDLTVASFDPVAGHGVTQPPADQDAVAGCRGVRKTIDHGEILAFEPSTHAEN